MKQLRYLLIYIFVLTMAPVLHGSNEEEVFTWVTVTNQLSGEPVEGVSVTLNQAFIGETGPLGRILVPEGMPGDLIAFFHTSFAPAYFSRLELKNNGFVVHLKESVLNIQEVVISANRVEQDFQKSSQEVRTINAKRMDQTFQSNAADALGIDPNVFIQKSQSGGGSPMIRGMSTSRVLLMVDGIRINNAIFREGNVHNVISIDPESLSNVEVSLGPGSVLHGSDALGGVMHLNTYDAHYGDTSEVLQSLVFTLSNQSGQLARRPNFRINYGGLNWAGVTTMTYSQFTDVRMGHRLPSWVPASNVENMFLSYVPELFGNLDTMYAPKDPYIQSNTAYDQRNLSSRFKARIAPKTEIKAGVYASTTSSINRFDRYLETKNNMPKYAKWNYGPQTWTMGYLSIENRSEAKAFDWIKATASVQYFEESRDVRKFKYLVGRVQREQVYIGQLNIDASKKLAPWANLLYGAEILRNDVRSTAWQYHERMPDTTWATQTRYANGSYWESASLFASANLDLASNLTLSSGLRMNGVHMYSPISFNGFEQEADLRFTAPSAELGLTYYRPTFKYFLNLSTGFRAPNVDDASKVFDSQPGALIIPNPDLHEERLYSAELGMKQKLGSKWAVDASFYYSYLDEALERAPYNFQGRDSVFYDNEFSQVLAIQNIDYAWIWGYQFGIRTDLSDNLHWMIHWAHPFGYDSKGNPLRHAHPFNATSTLSYQKEKLRTNLVLRYNGSVDADEMPFSELEKTFIYAINENGELYTPAWYTINVYGSYHFSKNILVRLGIENLMDLRYRSYSSGIAAPGRSVYFSVRMSL